MKTLEILKALQSAVSSGCRFVSFGYQAKSTGELAEFQILLNVNIATAYKSDIKRLKILHTSGVKDIARKELIDSFQKSLEMGVGNNPDYTCKGVYQNIGGGIKFHSEKNQIYISGYQVKKNVLIKGKYKERNSSPLTIAKQELMKICKKGRFRQFCLDVHNIAGIHANKKVLNIQTQ